MLLLPLASVPPPPDTASAGCDTGPHVTWDSFGEGFFTTYCQACHSGTAPNRAGAPVGVDFDTEAQVRAQAERVRVRVLDEGTMPVGGGVYEDDRELLARYLACGL
ncbi:MAG: hypothetical protein ACK4YP_00825 [Myxococcota bacterium]